jgi:hypothetical protein
VLPPDGKNGLFVRKTYGTFRNDLTRMRGWLKLLKVTEIVMESTGVYCVECSGSGILAVADGRDPKRIAEFLHDGRLDPSFVPPAETQVLRSIVANLYGDFTSVHVPEAGASIVLLGVAMSGVWVFRKIAG